MKIKSVFDEGGRIPIKYTCDGMNINPPLEFLEVPKEAKSLALIVDDPDSPSGIFTHWIIWNLPPATRAIKESSVPSSSVEGTNDFVRAGYGGPCPRSGTHRYMFRLFALDRLLNLPPGSEKDDFEKAMKGHVIQRAVLTGVYSR